MAVNEPFTILGIPGASPVILSVPHAGRDYPPDIAAQLAVPFDQARALEDRHADALATSAVAHGHAAIVAHTPRLLIDLNRAESDFLSSSIRGASVAAARPSHRARGGLGLIPERLHGAGRLWRTPPDASVLAGRIARVHRPYHTALTALLDAALARHGHAVLVDLHSMPPLALPHVGDVVIGDLHGRAAAPHVVAAAERALRQQHLKIARNRPYAGGHVLERHGRPGSGVHAIQIEIDRRLYLDAAMDELSSQIDAIRRAVATLADALAALPLARSLPVAAE